MRCKIIVNIFFFFFTTTSLLAQENFVPGHIVQHSGDTLYGLIDYRNWEKNPKKVSFKEMVGKESQHYTPLEITAFACEDEVYISAIIEAENSSLKTGNLSDSKAPKLSIDTVFLQTIVKGKKDLYYYKLESGRDNFYIKNGTEIELLEHRRYFVHEDGKKVIKENNRFLGQLSWYLSECKSTALDVKSAGYTKRDLLKLFNSYYECFPDEAIFKIKAEKMKVVFSGVAGLTITSLLIESEEKQYFQETNFPKSTDLTLGIAANLVLPRNQGKWSIYNELIFTTYDINAQHRDFTNNDVYTIRDINIGYSYLKLVNMVRYNYALDNISIFLNAGITNGLALKENNLIEEEEKFYSTERTVSEPAISETRGYEQGWVLGAGVIKDRLGLELRYESSNGMSKLQSLSSRVRRTYILLSYKF